jgi:uncharacterized membrane protein YccC
VGYVRTIWRGVHSVDLTKLRRWSAVRRGVLVILTMIAVSLLTDPETGSLAALAALFVGLQERNASASYTSRVMVVESFYFAAVVLATGILSQQRLAPIALLTLSAIAAGLAASHDKAMSRMFGDAMPLAAFLGLSSVESEDALVLSVSVLLAGLAQAGLARLSVRVEEDVMERRPVAAALVAVADHLDDALLRRRTATGQAAEERLTTAIDTLAVSDLARERQQDLRTLLADAELLRQEGAAVRTRRALRLPVGAEAQVADALANASAALRTVAAALTSVRIPGRFDYAAEAALAELYPRRLEAERVANDRDADPTARAVSRRVLRLVRHVAHLVDARAVRSKEHGRRVGEGMSEYLLHPTRRDLVIGLRLGAASLVAFGVAIAFNLPHGAWVAATAVGLLRPDWNALAVETVARALGTAAAAGLMIPLVWLVGDVTWRELLVMLVMAIAAFMVVSVNEGLYVAVIAMYALFSRAVLGENPMDAAAARVLDVVVGCTIALAFLVLVPVSHGRRLASDLAAYSAATAAWLEAIGMLSTGQSPTGEKMLRQSMREARVHVQHGVELRSIEPMGPGLPARRGEHLFAQVHEASRAGIAAERALRHGESTGADSELLARDAAEALSLLAAALRGAELPAPLPTPPDIEVDPDDVIAVLLRHAADVAHAAVESLAMDRAAVRD